MESKFKEIQLYGMSIDAATEERYVNFVEPYRDAYYDWAKKFTVDYDLDRSPMMWHIELGKPNIDLIEKGWKHGYGEVMVSGRIKRILEKYKLPKHQFTPIDVRYKGEPVEFYMFTIFENHKKYVDWENSYFIGCFDIRCKKIDTKKLFFDSLEDYSNRFFKYSIHSGGPYKELKIKKVYFDKFSEDVIYLSGIHSLYPEISIVNKDLIEELKRIENHSLQLYIGPKGINSQAELYISK